MATSEHTIEGTVNFSHITEHDVFQGQDTGAYSITITIPEDSASNLTAVGVKIRDYQGKKQRNAHPVHGVSTYVTKMKVLEEAVTEEDEDFRYG